MPVRAGVTPIETLNHAVTPKWRSAPFPVALSPTAHTSDPDVPHTPYRAYRACVAAFKMLDQLLPS
jgi:hypothetical protein